MRMNAPVQFRPVCQTFTRDGEDKMKGARGMIGVPVGKQNARLSARWIALGNQVSQKSFRWTDPSFDLRGAGLKTGMGGGGR